MWTRQRQTRRKTSIRLTLARWFAAVERVTCLPTAVLPPSSYRVYFMPKLHCRRTVLFVIRLCMSLLALLNLCVVSLAAADRSGSEIYQQQCASCHGASGEGTLESYPHPLAGDRSVGELTQYISKTMPEDKPGTCTGEDARKVAEFISESFYSATAQARNKPARIELSRLTVRQYRNAIADLIGSFRSPGKLDSQPGLRAEYFKSRRLDGKERVIDRVDPVVQFDFTDKSPDAEKIEPHEFAIRWEGAVFAPETGEYEFLVQTDQATRLWINDLKQPLIDVWVKSGSDTEHRESIFLLGGRTYPLKLEFSKAKQGVDDKKAKEKPPTKASIVLQWKRPHRIAEVIPARSLSPSRLPETFAVMTPFPPDDRSYGWERGTAISKEWHQATTDGAIEIAAYVVAHLNELAGTKSGNSDYDKRLREFCQRFASRAFRRPLTDEQQRAFVEHHFKTAADPEAAVKRVVLHVLKSPRFLFRELSDREPKSGNDSYDVASRISFALWDSIPDQQLLDVSGKGQLATREQVEQQAQRMLTDPRTRSKLREFFLRWLKVEHVLDVAKDTERFPEFNAVIADDLRTSLEMFLDELLGSETADFRQVLLSDSLPLNGRLAKFYGAELPDDAPFQAVKLESGERAGVLSHPYLMAGFAYTASSSPIHRGVFIARSVLGRSLRPPPEAVAPLAPALHADLTTRERIALQTKPESCQSCHAMINPLGFTLENFDAVGRYRKDENGKPVDATGGYRTRSGATIKFAGVRDLATFLANSEETHSAFVEQLFHGLIKQPIRAYGSQTRSILRQKFVDNNFNIRKLVAEIVSTAVLTATDSEPQTPITVSPP